LLSFSLIHLSPAVSLAGCSFLSRVYITKSTYSISRRIVYNNL
jgi:hypothetical protein